MSFGSLLISLCRKLTGLSIVHDIFLPIESLRRKYSPLLLRRVLPSSTAVSYLDFAYDLGDSGRIDSPNKWWGSTLTRDAYCAWKNHFQFYSKHPSDVEYDLSAQLISASGSRHDSSRGVEVLRFIDRAFEKFRKNMSLIDGMVLVWQIKILMFQMRPLRLLCAGCERYDVSQYSPRMSTRYL